MSYLLDILKILNQFRAQRATDEQKEIQINRNLHYISDFCKDGLRIQKKQILKVN